MPTGWQCGLRKGHHLRHFWLGQVALNAFQQQMIAQGFWFDWNQFSDAIFLLGIIKWNHRHSLCNTQQLTRQLSG